MNFTVNTLTRCANQGHYVLSVTVGANTYDIETERSVMEFEPLEDREATRDAIIGRCRSAVKEANAANFTQARTALEGKVFKL